MKTRDYEKKSEDFVADETITEEDVKPVAKAKSKKYIITVPNLARRLGPGKEYEKLGLANEGLTLISDIRNGFGKLADGTGWVCMDYVREAD